MRDLKGGHKSSLLEEGTLMLVLSLIDLINRHDASLADARYHAISNLYLSVRPGTNNFFFSAYLEVSSLRIGVRILLDVMDFD